MGLPYQHRTKRLTLSKGLYNLSMQQGTAQVDADRQGNIKSG